MRKLIAILLLALALTLVACKPGLKETTKPSAEAPAATEASVSDVESEIGDLDSLEQELDLSDLDSLEQDLDMSDI